MGQSAAETVREIEETREQLEGDLKELEQRLPAPARAGKKLAGMVIGGGVAGTVLMFGLKRWRKGRKEAKLAEQAAEHPVNAVIQVLPDDVAEKVGEAFEDGRWKGWAAGIGGLLLVMKLAEMRQNRKLLAALAAR